MSARHGKSHSCGDVVSISSLFGIFRQLTTISATTSGNTSAVETRYQGTLPKLPEEYARITVPALCLWGANDHHFPPAHALPRAKLQLIDGGQHWLPLQMPREFAAAIRGFVGTVIRR